MAINTHENPLFTEFSEDEKSFLNRIFATYPKIEENFVRYLGLHEDVRWHMAIHDAKHLKRTGWLRNGIDDPESVATHTGSAMWLARLRTPMHLNRERVSEMLEVHDLPEVIITDFTPDDGFNDEDRLRLEVLAMRVLAKGLPRVDYLCGLIQEYGELKTPEARWVNDVDKMDAVYQAIFYEACYPEKMGIFRNFADYTRKKLLTDEGVSLLDSLEANAQQWRDDRRAEYLGWKRQAEQSGFSRWQSR